MRYCVKITNKAEEQLSAVLGDNVDAPQDPELVNEREEGNKENFETEKLSWRVKLERMHGSTKIE